MTKLKLNNYCKYLYLELQKDENKHICNLVEMECNNTNTLLNALYILLNELERNERYKQAQTKLLYPKEDYTPKQLESILKADFHTAILNLNPKLNDEDAFKRLTEKICRDNNTNNQYANNLPIKR